MWKIGVIKSGSRLCWPFFFYERSPASEALSMFPWLFLYNNHWCVFEACRILHFLCSFESHVLGGLSRAFFNFFLSFLFTDIHHSCLERKLNIMGRLQPANEEDSRDIDKQSCFIHGFEMQLLYYGASHHVTHKDIVKFHQKSDCRKGAMWICPACWMKSTAKYTREFNPRE